MTEKENHTEREKERSQGGFSEDGKKFMPHFITNVSLYNTNNKGSERCACVCVCSSTAPGFKLFIHIITIHSVLNPITCFSASHH